MKGTFRPRAPMVPQLEGKRENLAVQAVKRAVEQQDNAKDNGRMTELVTLGVHGTIHAIEHKLNRMPVGFDVAYVLGFPPKYRVTNIDDKRITLVSLDQVDVCGQFTTAPGGSVSAGSGYLWSAAQNGTGIYEVTLPFEASALLSASMDNTAPVSNVTKYTTSTFGASCMVRFTNYITTTATDLSSKTCLFRVSMTGASPKFKLWVY